MFLIKYSECEKEISDKERSCPKCEYPQNNISARKAIRNKKKSWYRNKIIIILLCLFFPPAVIIIIWKYNIPFKNGLKILYTVLLVIWTIALFSPKEKMDNNNQGNDIIAVSDKTKDEENNNENETEIQHNREVVTNVADLTNEEYKEYCEELWHNEIFFSEENLEGHHVKLEIYIEESKYFTANSIYNQTIVDFMNKYNLQRELFACGVSRKESDSYVGGQINLYFSDDYEYKQSDYKTGQELIIYGEIVDYSRNTWSGYNECGVIPRYIEEK